MLNSFTNFNKIAGSHAKTVINNCSLMPKQKIQHKFSTFPSKYKQWALKCTVYTSIVIALNT